MDNIKPAENLPKTKLTKNLPPTKSAPRTAFTQNNHKTFLTQTKYKHFSQGNQPKNLFSPKTTRCRTKPPRNFPWCSRLGLQIQSVRYMDLSCNTVTHSSLTMVKDCLIIHRYNPFRYPSRRGIWLPINHLSRDQTVLHIASHT